MHHLADKGFIVEDNVILACNGVGLKNILWAGEQWLATHRQVVNSLNVFPVPDGDTGTNMLLTIRSVMAEVDDTADQGVGAIASAAAHGALIGARGNSGVILSQFLQGIAAGLKNKVTFTAAEFAHAAELGATQAYQSVIEPVEGTMLTVARAAAEAARLSARTQPDLLVLWTDVVEAVRLAQADTPNLLPVLGEAGVTDSGGQGLLYLLEGGLRFLQNKTLKNDELAVPAAPKLPVAVGVNGKEHGYDVQFLIKGERLNIAQIRANIEQMGRSVLAVGDEQLVKVHVHVGDPQQPLSYGAMLGQISDVVIENLNEQTASFVRGRANSGRSSSSATAHIATVAVVLGQGLAEIFKDLGVDKIVPGGQGMNPSTQELLAVVGEINADNVLILPNNNNIILTAQQVRKLTQKQVQVIATQTIPQGIAALLAFNRQTDCEANVARMSEAARAIHTLEITHAVQDTRLSGLKVRSGDLLGLLNSDLVSAGRDYIDVVRAGLARLAAQNYEILTIYRGCDCTQLQAETLAHEINQLYPDLEIEVYSGGQPHYHYIISVE